jgi:hypothetical protein
MTDHHDFGFEHHDPGPFDETPFGDGQHSYGFDDHVDYGEPHLDLDDPHPAVEDSHVPAGAYAPLEAHVDDPAPDLAVPGIPDISDFSEMSATDVFPPPVDVGDLPEPVDGFPWIDTGSLGLVHAAPADDVDPVQPQELAEYSATELPPAVDPWEALADSDDPATSTLARWWSEN